MSPFFLIFFLLPLTFQLEGRTPPKFRINLDDPAELRWKEVILAKKDQIQQFNYAVLHGLNIPSFLINFIDFFADKLYNRHEFLSEIRGIAEYSEIPFAEVFVLNFVYEIFAFCTSIISQDTNGNIIHGRNLDYGLSQYFANLTVHLEFYKNNSLLFKADSMAGFTGVLTGLKDKAFGVSLNQRNKKDIWEVIYELVVNRVYTVPFFMRIVLENANNYTEAVELFKKEQFAGPCYLIVSGVEKNEGVIIERNRKDINNITYINQENEWFIVQTNYDRGVPDPSTDERRIPAENRMRGIGRSDINMERMMNEVLSVAPNRNKETISSSVMSAQSGDFNTTLWF